MHPLTDVPQGGLVDTNVYFRSSSDILIEGVPYRRAGTRIGYVHCVPRMCSCHSLVCTSSIVVAFFVFAGVGLAFISLTDERRHRHGPRAYRVYLADSLARCLVATRQIHVTHGSTPARGLSHFFQSEVSCCSVGHSCTVAPSRYSSSAREHTRDEATTHADLR